MVKSAELKNAVEIVDDSTINFKEEESDNGSSKDVTFVRVIWIDASGQHKCRVIPRQHFNTSVKKHGVGLSCSCMGKTSHSDRSAVNTNLSSTGQIRIVPDLSTKCTIPWTKHQEMVLADMFIQPGKAWDTRTLYTNISLIFTMRSILFLIITSSLILLVSICCFILFTSVIKQRILVPCFFV